VRFRLPEPSRGERKRQRHSNQDEDARYHQKQIKQLPDEISPSRAHPTAPAFANVAFSRDDAVKQNESHHAAHVHKNDADSADRDKDHPKQRNQEHGIHSGKADVRRAGMGGHVKVGAIASVGAKFARQQPNERQPRPLTDAKRLEQLPLGMFQGGRDRVHGSKWQLAPQATNGFTASY